MLNIYFIPIFISESQVGEKGRNEKIQGWAEPRSEYINDSSQFSKKKMRKF